MAKHLTENFINLSNWRFRPNRGPELALNHREHSLHVRPLVVMLQESFPVEVVEVPHPIREAVKLMMMVSNTSRIGLEGDKGRATLSLNSPKILPVRVGSVGGDLIDGEGLSGLVYQSGELDIISRFVSGSFYARDNMGGDTAHQ